MATVITRVTLFLNPPCSDLKGRYRGSTLRFLANVICAHTYPLCKAPVSFGSIIGHLIDYARRRLLSACMPSQAVAFSTAAIHMFYFF